MIAPGMRNPGASQWKVDEADAAGAAGPSNGDGGDANGEFKRNLRTARESSADFGSGHMEDDDDDDDQFHSGAPQFASYLAQEIQSSEHFSSDEASSDEEDDSGWLAHSTFELRPPPVAARPHDGGRRPLSSSGFEDTFEPGSSSSSTVPTAFHDPFDDDAFSPFSDAAAASGSDPFTFTPGLTADDIIDEASSLDSFGDFGDFQSAGGEGSSDHSDMLAPTADSWSFASTTSSSTGSVDEFGGNGNGGGSGGRAGESPKEHERT